MQLNVPPDVWQAIQEMKRIEMEFSINIGVLLTDVAKAGLGDLSSRADDALQQLRRLEQLRGAGEKPS